MSRTYTMGRQEARNALEYLTESYCVDQLKEPKEGAVERLTRLALTEENSTSWVRVSGHFGAKQDVLDRALYGSEGA